MRYKVQQVLRQGAKVKWSVNERFLSEYVNFVKDATTTFQDKLVRGRAYSRVRRFLLIYILFK